MWSNPDWSYRDDGSSSSYDLDLCDNRVINGRGNDIRQAYYMLEGVNRLHAYFMGLAQSFEVSAVASSLSKESWFQTFYHPKNNDKTISTLREFLNAITTALSIGASFAGLGTGAALRGAISGLMATTASGAAAAGSIQLASVKDETFEKDAQLGSILAKVVVDSLKSFASANNELMAGHNYKSTGDIRSYLAGGAFVDFGGVDKNAVVDVMNKFLLGKLSTSSGASKRSSLWLVGNAAMARASGPGRRTTAYVGTARRGVRPPSPVTAIFLWGLLQEAETNQFPFHPDLYYWHEGNGDFLSAKQWGYVTMPPGADKPGQGDFAGVAVVDVINSSLDSYNVAGYNYGTLKANERVHDALQNGWRNPGAQGPSWEGTFTIPVCDVSGAIGQGWTLQEYILEEYDGNARPCWCGPICSNDWDKTKRFIEAANMGAFKTPKHICLDKGVAIYYLGRDSGYTVLHCIVL
ncbi:hypothetical protein AAE478_007703 [Parahypoxylon ruwenzoriense]